MQIIKDIKNLNKVFEPYLEKAMILTRDKIFEVISNKVSDYYNEPVFNNDDKTEPLVYERSGKLMESLTASHISKDINSLSFTVGWDDDYLSFQYYNQLDPQRPGITGLSVLHSFNQKRHGWTVEGSHNYWDEAIDELGGEQGIINIFKSNCKKVGLSIK